MGDGEGEWPRVEGAAPSEAVTEMGWEVYPRALTDLLVRLHGEYPLPHLYITENGAAYPDRLENGEVHDAERIAYLALHIAAVEVAVKQGVPVKGYFAWSLMDNFEWAHGYDKRFGLVHVDYQTQARTLKDSAEWYRKRVAVSGQDPIPQP